MSGLNDNLDLATLATESGYSRAQFLRMFRAATGQTPHRYLLELRLEKTRVLIASRMPLVDIAAACGFSQSRSPRNGVPIKVWPGTKYVPTGATCKTLVETFSAKFRSFDGNLIPFCKHMLGRWEHT